MRRLDLHLPLSCLFLSWCLYIGVWDFLCPKCLPHLALPLDRCSLPPFHSSLLGSVHHAWVAEAKAGVCFWL